MNIEQLYREVIMDHYKHPRHKGLVDDANYLTVHLNNPSCGDELTVQLHIINQKIIDIRHQGTARGSPLVSNSIALPPADENGSSAGGAVPNSGVARKKLAPTASAPVALAWPTRVALWVGNSLMVTPLPNTTVFSRPAGAPGESRSSKVMAMLNSVPVKG